MSDDEPRGPGVIPIAALATVVCALVFWWPLLSWLGWL